MSQNPLVIVDGSGATVIAEVNDALNTLATKHSGASEPATTYAYMLWADTTSGVMKQRNATNTAWINRGPLAETLVIPRSSNTVLDAASFMRTIIATGTWSQTINSCASLGDGWWCGYRNDGTGVITLDPSGAETIDGAATAQLAPGETCFIYCDGTQLKTLGRSSAAAQNQTATAFTTAGTAPNFTLAPVPAITAYAANQRFRVAFNANGTTGSNTLTISGVSAKNLKQYDSTGTKVPAVVVSGQLADVEYDGTDMVILNPLPTSSRQIQPITASVAGNALTLTLGATTLDFRSSTLGSGTVHTRTVSSPISLVVSSGSTLGTTSGVAARLAVLAIDNAGTVELAVTNLNGGLNLDETTLISTTAEGGAGAADSANVIYSTTARTNVPFRVVGFVDATEATAGTWATAPSLIQGAGGNAAVALQSLGYSQSYQDVTVSRAFGTTYYNTTGRPIVISLWGSSSATQYLQLTINGTAVLTSEQALNAGTIASLSATIPVGASYSVSWSSSSVTLTKWFELR